MTTPASIFSLVRHHAEAALSGLVILIIVAAIWGANVAGKHTQAAIDAVATRQAIDSQHVAEQLVQANALAELRDTAEVLARSQARLDSGQTKSRGESAKRETAANLQRAKTSIDTATSTIVVKTDTGSVTLAVAPLVAVTWAADRAADVSTIESLRSSLLADSLSMAARDRRLNNDSLQFVRRDSIDAEYEARLKNKDGEIDDLKKTKTPHFTAVQGVVGGVVGTLGAILALVFAFR